jgi:hypothetical protein
VDSTLEREQQGDDSSGLSREGADVSSREKHVTQGGTFWAQRALLTHPSNSSKPWPASTHLPLHPCFLLVLFPGNPTVQPNDSTTT